MYEEKERWKLGLKCVSRSVVSNSLLDPKDCSPPGFFVHGTLQARILEWVAMPSPGDLPNPGTEPRFPEDSLPSESPGNSNMIQYPQISGIHHINILEIENYMIILTD